MLMKINTRKSLLHLAKFTVIVLAALTLSISSAHAKVVDDDPVTDQRWVISEIYLGGDDYKGAYLELYNNDEHTALGWKDFIVNLPFDVDLPPIYDLKTYKTHAYKTLPMDEGWVGWLAKKYIQVMYGDSIFHEIQDALDEEDGYSYQRCQSTYDDGTRVISNKFYYGKKTPGKPIDCDDKSVTMSNPADLPQAGLCTKLKLNEIGSNLADEEQFIELINDGNTTVNLSNCYLATSKSGSANHFQLDNLDLEPGGIYNLAVGDTDIGPIGKTSGIVYLIDSDDETVVNYKRYSSSKADTSVALDEDGKWQTTYRPTPGADNVIETSQPCPTGQYRDDNTGRCRKQLANDNTTDSSQTITGANKAPATNTLKPCQAGYERNPLTNRCRKVVNNNIEDSGLTPCKEGYERNPETNRCRKITTDEEADAELTPCREGYERNPATNRCVKKSTNIASSALTPCKEGYTRNPATNRCIKIASADKELTPCKEGYERNPETNRCVKKKSAGAGQSSQDDAAKYPVDSGAPSADNQSTSTISLIIAIAAVIVVSLGILIWQYRQEISRWWHKLAKK